MMHATDRLLLDDDENNCISAVKEGYHALCVKGPEGGSVRGDRLDLFRQHVHISSLKRVINSNIHQLIYFMITLGFDLDYVTLPDMPAGDVR